MKAHQRRIVFLGMLVLAFSIAILSLRGMGLAANAPNQGKESATSPTSSLSGSSQITITAAGFDPAVLTVTVSTEVTWYNAADVTHTLQSGAPWRIFLPVVLKNSGGGSGLAAERAAPIPRTTNLTLASSEPFSATLPPGGTFTHTFTSVGDHSYFLATAPQFSGRVIVWEPPNQPPMASITAPQDGEWITPGEPITFTGEATDPEDGPLTGASLVWASDRDGQIGIGETFTATLTSTGMHTITLTATDSGGLTDTARIEVRVLTPGITGGPPLLTVLANSALDSVTGVAVNSAETLAYVTCDSGTELKRVDIDPDSPTFGQVTVVADTGLTDLQIGVALNPAETHAYVLEGVGELSRVDLSTGQVTLVASGMQNPHGLALDAAGSMAYVTEGDRLSRVVIATGTVSTVASGLNGPHGVALSADGTKTYVAELWEGQVSAVDLASGNVTTLATGLSQPAGVAVHSDGTDAYVTEFDSGELSRVNLVTGEVTLVADGLDGPSGLAVNGNESLAYVAEQNGGRLTAVYLGESPVTVIVPGESGVTDAAGIAVNGAGTLAYVAEEREGDGEISQVDPTTGQVTTLVGGLNQPNGLTLNQAETHLYVAGNIGDPVVLVAVELATGQVITVSEELGGGLSGVALSPDETLAYVVNFGSGELSVVDVDPASPTFQQVMLITGGLNQPRDIVLNSAGNLAYVTEQGSGELSVVGVDPASPGYGDITLIADGLGGPRGLTLNQIGNLVYLAEEFSRELSVVDVDPGSAGYGNVTTILDHLSLRDVALGPDERTAMLADADDGILVVDIDPGSPDFGRIIELTPVPLNGARGLDLGGGDTIAYVVSEFSGKLSWVDIDPTSPTFGAVADIADDLFILNDVDVNRDETLAYVTREAGPENPPVGRNVVSCVDLTTGEAITVTDQLGQPTNIVLSQDEIESYVVDLQQGGLYRVNLATGVVTPVVTGLDEPFAVAVNRAETLAYVVTVPARAGDYPKGSLLRIDIQTGQVFTVTAEAIHGASGITLSADERQAFVTEFGLEAACTGKLSVVDIDPTSPTYGTVTPLLTGLCGPHDVRLNAAESVAYVVEVDARRLIAID